MVVLHGCLFFFNHFQYVFPLLSGLHYFFMFFSLCSMACIISIALISGSLILFSAPVYLLLSPLLNFLFQLFHFWTPEFPFGPLKNVIIYMSVITFSIWYSIVIIPLFLWSCFPSSVWTYLQWLLWNSFLLSLTSGYSHRQFLFPASFTGYKSHFICLVSFCGKLNILDNIL